MVILFSNNHSSSGFLLTKLHANGFVGHSNLAQVYSLVPGIHCQLFGPALGGGEVGMEEPDSVDRCVL